MEEVKKLQRKILNAAHKSESEHARLNDVYATTFKLAQNIRKLIAEEQDNVDKKLNPKKTLSPLKAKKLTARQQTDLRVRKTQLDGQSTRMYNIWSDYNQCQVQFREQSKKLFVRQCKVMGNTSLSNEEIEQMIDEGKNVFARVCIYRTLKFNFFSHVFDSTIMFVCVCVHKFNSPIVIAHVCMCLRL